VKEFVGDVLRAATGKTAGAALVEGTCNMHFRMELCTHQIKAYGDGLKSTVVKGNGMAAMLTSRQMRSRSLDQRTIERLLSVEHASRTGCE